MKTTQEQIDFGTTALLAALGSRTPETAFHCQRVTRLAVDLGRALGLPGYDLNIVRLSALLHDIGKIALPDTVLSKPEPLNAEEWKQMHQHPLLGANMLRSLDFPETICLAVEQHHERLDGRGYPFKLRKKQTSLTARILSVADTYDAITRDRCYRKGKPPTTALAEISSCSRTQFDPDIVAVLVRLNSVAPQKLAA
jgi:putative nucleotidyltransferase with HDIG domain